MSLSSITGIIRSLEQRGGIFETGEEIREFRRLFHAIKEQEAQAWVIKRLIQLPTHSLGFRYRYDSKSEALHDRYVISSTPKLAMMVASTAMRTQSGVQALAFQQFWREIRWGAIELNLPVLELTSIPIPIWMTQSDDPFYHLMSTMSANTTVTVPHVLEAAPEFVYRREFANLRSEIRWTDVVRNLADAIMIERGTWVPCNTDSGRRLDYFIGDRHPDEALAEWVDTDHFCLHIRELLRTLLTEVGIAPFALASAEQQYQWALGAVDRAHWSTGGFDPRIVQDLCTLRDQAKRQAYIDKHILSNPKSKRTRRHT